MKKYSTVFCLLAIIISSCGSTGRDQEAIRIITDQAILLENTAKTLQKVDSAITYARTLDEFSRQWSETEEQSYRFEERHGVSIENLPYSGTISPELKNSIKRLEDASFSFSRANARLMGKYIMDPVAGDAIMKTNRIYHTEH